MLIFSEIKILSQFEYMQKMTVNTLFILQWSCNVHTVI